MTRDETIALFLECEAARAAKQAAALGEGKAEHAAERIAHEAAKAHWNAWAEALLAKRKAMEADGRWFAYKDWKGDLEAKNEETRAWMEAATADFSRCLFLVRGVEGTKETAGEVEKAPRASEDEVKSIQLESSTANFEGFIFPGNASFYRATFKANAWFYRATFNGAAWFARATFKGNAWFDSATFNGAAWFARATFKGNAWFDSATVSGDARFARATFKSNAWFDSATVSGDARFISATFKGDARFISATFKGDAFFRRVRFEAMASFTLVHFRQYAAFKDSRFGADANFIAIRGDRGFDMARAVFEVVPDFIQAHFEEAPRLDNLEVGRKLRELKEIEDKEREKLGRRGRWHRRRLEKNPRYRRMFEAVAKDSDLRNIPARWRALKRLAIQGHDTERELEFHARELRSQRFTEDWPLPLAFWRGKAWAGFFRFWFGAFYGLFSDFGRSLARPAGFWLAAVVFGAVLYVSQSPDMIAARQGAKGAPAIVAAASGAWHAWASDRRPCFAGDAPHAETEEQASERESLPGKPAYTPPPYVGALSPSLQSGTDLANEAWHLAFRNAFIVLDGSGEAAHRTYGCLYGVELYGGSNPLAVVPSAVSTVSAAQKLFSALMIFLFGLALRNMLKMK
ncbi:MAG: pentapeptide repeat-containing protein [Rhodomicrobium sp.]